MPIRITRRLRLSSHPFPCLYHLLIANQLVAHSLGFRETIPSGAWTHALCHLPVQKKPRKPKPPPFIIPCRYGLHFALVSSFYARLYREVSLICLAISSPAQFEWYYIASTPSFNRPPLLLPKVLILAWIHPDWLGRYLLGGLLATQTCIASSAITVLCTTRHTTFLTYILIV